MSWRDWLAAQLQILWPSDAEPDEDGPSRIPDAALLHEFTADADRIEHAGDPIGAYTVLWCLVAILVVALIWSIVGHVDRIVIARGKVVTTSPVIVLQSFATSRVLDIHVLEGQHVRKGQSLVDFDPAFAQADFSSLQSKVRTLTTQKLRMEAELGDKNAFDVPPDLQGSTEYQAQTALFQARRAQYHAEVDARRSKLRELREQISANTEVRTGLENQLAYVERITQIRQELYDKHIGSLLQLLAAQKDESDLQIRLRETVAQGSSLSEQAAQAASDLHSFEDKWRSDLNQDLVTLRQNLTEASDSLEKARKMKDFTRMLSPIDGEVLEVADRSAGSVVREADTLVTLVPENAHLEVRADIATRDIGYVHTGDTARVKLEAYPFQRYGTIDAQVEALSPDSVTRKEGDKSNTVYPARVKLIDGTAQFRKRGIQIVPGLVATAEIRSGSRSIISYILYPVVRAFDESMREP